jgi:hypothetical protein
MSLVKLIRSNGRAGFTVKAEDSPDERLEPLIEPVFQDVVFFHPGAQRLPENHLIRP